MGRFPPSVGLVTPSKVISVAFSNALHSRNYILTFPEEFPVRKKALAPFLQDEKDRHKGVGLTRAVFQISLVRKLELVTSP